MSTKKRICFWLFIILLIPSFALATNYKVMDIFEQKIDTSNLIFKSGDKITGGKGISIDIYYDDAEGNNIEKGNNKIKAVTVGGEKCKEWVLRGTSASVIQLGRLVNGAFAFTMQPAYTAADAEGFYTVTSDTYSSYTSNPDKSKGKKVKFSGAIIANNETHVFIKIDNSLIIAVVVGATDYVPATDDNVQCRGEVIGITQYSSSNIPEISCSEISKVEYTPLAKGDRMPAVLAMKERLRDLGYFKAGVDLSDEYNSTCVDRVKAFQKANGLTATGIADVETLTLLYSDSAESK